MVEYLTTGTGGRFGYCYGCPYEYTEFWQGLEPPDLTQEEVDEFYAAPRPTNEAETEVWWQEFRDRFPEVIRQWEEYNNQLSSPEGGQ
jgi:hypothetical protein